MKSLIAALSVLLTINTFASSSISEKCELRTDKPDLLHELNKKEICEATFYALFDSEVLEYDYYLRIEAKGFTTTFSVQLNKIEAFIGSDRVSNTSGVLHWNPDMSKVILDK